MLRAWLAHHETEYLLLSTLKMLKSCFYPERYHKNIPQTCSCACDTVYVHTGFCFCWPRTININNSVRETDEFYSPTKTEMSIQSQLVMTAKKLFKVTDESENPVQPIKTFSELMTHDLRLV